MTKKERYDKVIGWFREHNPEASTELIYRTPYQLAVAVILSAQCTDKRVNMITPAFFETYPTFGELAVAPIGRVTELIRSCSYPNSKARNLVGMAAMVTGKFQGVLPSEVEILQSIPGIGRKTANVLASVLFNRPALAVDTHVFRVSARIGLTRGAKTPLESEKQLVQHIPGPIRSIAHHWLILHGRYICTARNPKCPECGLKEFCNYFISRKV